MSCENYMFKRLGLFEGVHGLFVEIVVSIAMLIKVHTWACCFLCVFIGHLNTIQSKNSICETVSQEMRENSIQSTSWKNRIFTHFSALFATKSVLITDSFQSVEKRQNSIRITPFECHFSDFFGAFQVLKFASQLKSVFADPIAANSHVFQSISEKKCLFPRGFFRTWFFVKIFSRFFPTDRFDEFEFPSVTKLFNKKFFRTFWLHLPTKPGLSYS